MIKINSKISLAVIYTVFTLLISGCTNKADVGFDDSTSKKKQPIQKEVKIAKPEPVINKLPRNIEAVDNTTDKLSQIKDVDVKKLPPLKDELSYVNVVTSDVNGVKVSLRSIHFAFDKFDLSDNMRMIAKDNYKIISPLVLDNKDLKIKLEGNCDEWGTDEYNYALGLKRAKTAKDALISDGIPEDKIILVTFGESNPICNDKSENCWKKNRRTDYRLLP